MLQSESGQRAAFCWRAPAHAAAQQKSNNPVARDTHHGRARSRVPIIQRLVTVPAVSRAGARALCDVEGTLSMNRLAAILPADNILLSVEATSKKRAFEQAGMLFENQHGIARGMAMAPSPG